VTDDQKKSLPAKNQQDRPNAGDEVRQAAKAPQEGARSKYAKNKEGLAA